MGVASRGGKSATPPGRGADDARIYRTRRGTAASGRAPLSCAAAAGRRVTSGVHRGAGVPPTAAAVRWELFPHDADVGVRGFGATPAEAFEQAAHALIAAITHAEITPD